MKAIGRILLGAAIVAATIAVVTTVPLQVHADEGRGDGIKVRFPDCGAALCVLPKIATDRLFKTLDDQREEIEELKARLVKAPPKCATVERTS
jgi:hypothetical protein